MNKEELESILRYISIKDKPKYYTVRRSLYDEDYVAYIKAFCDFTGHKMDERDIINCINYIKTHTLVD